MPPMRSWADICALDSHDRGADRAVFSLSPGSKRRFRIKASPSLPARRPCRVRRARGVNSGRFKLNAEPSYVPAVEVPLDPIA
jgi:hypothetical protein